MATDAATEMASGAGAATAVPPATPGAGPSAGPVRFTGRFRHTLDSKARLVLPAPFRAAFGDGGYLTLWQARCIAVLPAAEFDRWVERTRSQLEGSGLDDPAGLLRRLHARSTWFRPDLQGRLVVPEELRRSVGIDREVVVTGNDARLELWAVDVPDLDEEEHEDSITFFQATYDLLGR